MTTQEEATVEAEMPAYFMPRPPMDLDADTIAAFDSLFAEAVERGPDVQIDYKLDAPKWQFLCYLSDTQGVVLHGSGVPDIAEFEARQSNDTQEFGNRRAVYAASDGIWPMYFAIVNRDGPVCSLMNACFRVVDGDGNRGAPHYFFSINEDAFQANPWRDGMIYILPSAPFEQQGLEKHGDMQAEIAQWASPENVLPLAKLSVTPEDFPFLAQVRGHNVERVMERTRSDPDGFPWLDEP